MSLEQELAKLKYRVKLLCEASGDIDSHASLAIELDWTADDMKSAHDIFEKFDKQLSSAGSVNGAALENELRHTFDIGYQEVKSIVCVFWKHGQWQSVCKHYAEQHRCSEFHEILGIE